MLVVPAQPGPRGCRSVARGAPVSLMARCGALPAQGQGLAAEKPPSRRGDGPSPNRRCAAAFRGDARAQPTCPRMAPNSRFGPLRRCRSELGLACRSWETCSAWDVPDQAAERGARRLAAAQDHQQRGPCFPNVRPALPVQGGAGADDALAARSDGPEPVRRHSRLNLAPAPPDQRGLRR